MQESPLFCSICMPPSVDLGTPMTVHTAVMGCPLDNEEMFRPIQQVGAMNAAILSPPGCSGQWPPPRRGRTQGPSILRPPAAGQLRPGTLQPRRRRFPRTKYSRPHPPGGCRGPLASGTLDASPRTAPSGQQASVQVPSKETQAFIFQIVKNLRKYFQ